MRQLLPLLLLLLLSCSKQRVSITNQSPYELGERALVELSSRLERIYPEVRFSRSGGAEQQIILINGEQLHELMPEQTSMEDGSFRIIEQGNTLYIAASSPRSTMDGCYALLERLGYRLYLTQEIAPTPREWSGFEGWAMEDSPIVESRYLFNWHNFISGCTGWNLKEWKGWIDGASKMRYNAIMVHAYGNNPMFSYEFMGERKATGFFNNTASGRDWGNQHISDVRDMVGGEIFAEAVYGAEASFATSHEQAVESATSLMQQSFQYAEMMGIDIYFAVDLDTWMSNPQNILEKMPESSLFKVGDKLTPNPDSEQGYLYYKSILASLIEQYPEVDEFTAWSRSPNNKSNPNLGSLWMPLPYEHFPAEWRKEYKSIIARHPEIKDEPLTQGCYAFSRIVAALQRAATELGSEVRIGYGSWGFDWLPVMDIFLDKQVPIRPLDATIKFDEERYDKLMQSVASHRPLHPIVWAHHDDFSYLGRPYTPYAGLSTMLEERELSGLGIIHWTTHPLDLYFAGTGAQLWRSGADIDYSTVVNQFVEAEFGELEPNLTTYYNEWAHHGPMFGRETSDHVIDLGKIHWKSPIESWESLIAPTEQRIAMIERTPAALRNDYWRYQRGMEEFYLSFFKNQAAFHNAYNLLEGGDVAAAAAAIEGCDPERTIRIYTDAIKEIDFTEGERMIVASLGSRWMVDFDNLRQRCGKLSILTRFAPTTHDPLAQMPGVNSYFIERESGRWWSLYWQHELPEATFACEGERSFMYGSGSLEVPLTTMHHDALAAGEYTLQLRGEFAHGAIVSIIEAGRELTQQQIQAPDEVTINFSHQNGDIKACIKGGGEMKLYQLTITPR